MSNLHEFISDLAIILVIAGVITIIFKKLNQPVVLGYIVAGFLASLHFKRFAEDIVVRITGEKGVLFDILERLPEISDMTNVTIWADIGVIFLLFALGLDFSFKKLGEVGGTASIATFINAGAMICLGYLTGQLLGWSSMDSIFLGGMLSMSSTTIIIKSFSDMGLGKKKFAGIVFGMLIIEDLVAVLILVLLSALAVSSSFEGTDLIYNILKLAFFILIWFLVGIYLIPTVFKRLKKHLNDETLLVVSIGLCLGMVYFATSVGFSSALGAFVMGSILGETLESKQIERLLEPLKNLFGAIFFVSVGMMINPVVIGEYAGIILILTLLVVVGRALFGTIGVAASGQSLKVAVQSGFSVALIGEFSFIIASLGMDLGVISNHLYPIIVSVSVISIFVSPYMIKSSEAAYNKLNKLIPKSWTTLREGYAASNYNNISKDNEWKRYLNSTLQTVVIYFSLSLAILLLSYTTITPFVHRYFHNVWADVADGVLSLLAMAAFLRSMMLKNRMKEEYASLWNANNLNKGLLVFIFVVRIIVGIVLISALLIPLFPQVPSIVMILISIVLAAIIILTKELKSRSRSMEARFMTNLYRKDELKEGNSVFSASVTNNLRKKEIHIEEIVVSQTSPSAGKTLAESNFRSRTGVHVVSIIRGNKTINIPKADERVFPLDTLVVAGSDEEITNLLTLLETRANEELAQENQPVESHVNIAQLRLVEGSLLIGKTVMELDIQNRAECLIIGIDREGDGSITDFTPTFKLEKNDTLWLAGEADNLRKFEERVTVG